VLIQVIILLIVVGVVLWVIETLLPIDARIKRVIYALIAVVVVIWLLQVAGVVGGNLRIGTVE
jgi:hypothetical protein